MSTKVETKKHLSPKNDQKIKKNPPANKPENKATADTATTDKKKSNVNNEAKAAPSDKSAANKREKNESCAKKKSN